MGIRKNVSKMFNVLVVGGTIMATPTGNAEESGKGQEELKATQSTINAILKEDDDQNDSCLTPFCNCWLG